MSRVWIPKRIAKLVRERADDRCEYCLLPQEWQESEFHIDHIRPRVAGGDTRLENLALACVGCSLKKAARQSVFDSRTGRMVRLFHPRTDNWSDHFTWDERWRIVGSTPVGRATVAALQLNRRRLLEIRRDLARLGRYPPDRIQR